MTPRMIAKTPRNAIAHQFCANRLLIAWSLAGQPGVVAEAIAEGAVLMDVHFDPVVLKLLDIIKRALPDHSEEDIFWGYHFVTGALMNTLARTGRIDRLSGGLCHSDDFAAVKQAHDHFGRLDVHRAES